nr:uncharacterized protein LOC113736456 isoform X1 [Coffea arabica]XP_027119223.1 uncharacterized protein LOC113736456 isoform X1 [Coffea arabica]XP_027119224.1 uncharacterized protein LOC113736456 isoform X1 [Coffea arabica]XP_027119225.1 uncharacterized protein LOC113736456 isoform X1 [Coffea arabica]XP_027119226.1 uncharacterized protein LOC113736456 isoform X1 [Coffea arabica]XP_027119227.1 uncharacterized protein LOC113736456 isoform X1 [Coffea arabica]XP_027119246.1 uncharacterized prot
MVYCFLGLPVSLSFACWISRCCFFFSCLLFSFSAGVSQKTSSEYFPRPLSLTEFLLAQPRQSSSSGQLFLLFSLLDLSLFFELASGKLFHLLFSHRWPQENFRPPFVVSALAVLRVLFSHFLDVMGIVVHAFPARDVYMEGTMRHGRDYVIVDHSKLPILLTLWEDFESIEGCVIDEAMPTMPIIIAMRVRVLTENYISLSTQPSSVILVAPDVLEARELDCWCERNVSELVHMIFDNKSYADPAILLPPVRAPTLTAISSVASFTRFFFGLYRQVRRRLERKNLLCYIKHSSDVIRSTAIAKFTVVTCYLC